MFLKLRKPEKHAKVRINEHNTKEKPKFLLFLSNESTKKEKIDLLRDMENLITI